MAWPAIRRLLHARKVEVHTDEEIQAMWRGYAIHVQRSAGAGGNWYIAVLHPDGCHLYDGWWRDSAHKTLAEAVEEAFRGACLLEKLEVSSNG